MSMKKGLDNAYEQSSPTSKVVYQPVHRWMNVCRSSLCCAHTLSIAHDELADT